MSVDELLGALADLGFRVSLSGDGPRVERPHNGAELPLGVAEQLAACRAEVVAHLLAGLPHAECAGCGRDITDPRDRARLATVNPFCESNRCPQRRGR